MKWLSGHGLDEDGGLLPTLWFGCMSVDSAAFAPLWCANTSVFLVQLSKRNIIIINYNFRRRALIQKSGCKPRNSPAWDDALGHFCGQNDVCMLKI